MKSFPEQPGKSLFSIFLNEETHLKRKDSHMKDSTDQIPQFMKYFFVAFIVCASASMLIVYWLGHA